MLFKRKPKETIKTKKVVVDELDLATLLKIYTESIGTKKSKMAALRTLATFTRKYVPKTKATKTSLSKDIINQLYHINETQKLNTKEKKLVDITLRSLI